MKDYDEDNDDSDDGDEDDEQDDDAADGDEAGKNGGSMRGQTWSPWGATPYELIEVIQYICWNSEFKTECQIWQLIWLKREK